MILTLYDYIRVLYIYILRKSIRAEGKFLFFVLATFYLEVMKVKILSYKSRYFEIKSS